MRAVFSLTGFGLILFSILWPGHGLSFVHGGALIIVLGGTLFLSLAAQPAEALCRALFGPTGDAKSREAVATAVERLATVRSLALATAGAGTVLGLVQMVRDMNDPKTIGPAMALALLSTLYGVIIAELVLAPRINRILVDAPPEDARDVSAEADDAASGLARILFSLLGAAALVCGAATVGPLPWYFDPLSLAFVAGGTVLFTLGGHSMGSIGAALHAGLGRNEPSLARAHDHLAVFSTARTVALSMGVVGALVGFVHMLVRLDDPSAIGPAMAVALLCPIYGFIIGDVLLLGPTRRLRHRARDHGGPVPATPNHAVLFGLLLAVILCFLVVLASIS